MPLKINKLDLKACLFFLFLSVFFNIRLFLPPSIYSTPGDISYFYLPLKTIYAESLKSFSVPLWTNSIGTGVPLFAEAQIGYFYLPNMILFYFFPTWLAFAISYVFVFFTAQLGTYLFLSRLKLKRAAAIFGAIAFGFSFFFISRIAHFNHVQIIALLPLCLFLVESFLDTKKYRFLFLFTLVFASQIFIGYFQAAMNSLISYCIYFLLRTIFVNRKSFCMNALLFSFAIILAFFLSSVQLLPTFQLLKNSSRSAGFTTESPFLFSGSYKSLLNFLYPYVSGDPSRSTFKYDESLQLFWENSAYSGLLTVVFAGQYIWLLYKQKRTKGVHKLFLFPLMLMLSIFLVLGKYGPFRILFEWPPLEFFRIPSRFLFLTSFTLAVMAAITINKWWSKGKIAYFLILILVLDLFYFGFFYNPTISIKDYFRVPSEVPFLKKDENPFRISTIRSLSGRRITIQNLGWHRQNHDYLDSFDYLDANLNSRFEVESLDYYITFDTSRILAYKNLVDSGFEYDQDKKIVRLNSSSHNLMTLQNVKYLVTPLNVDNEYWKRIDANLESKYDVKLYKNEKPVSEFFLADDYKKLEDFGEFYKTVNSQIYDQFKDVFFENDPIFVRNNLKLDGDINIVERKPTEVTLETNTNKDVILVWAQSYYPNWMVDVDGTVGPSMPVNVNQQAVVVPYGRHRVTFFYDDKMFRIGGTFSLVSVAALLVIVLILKKKKLF